MNYKEVAFKWAYHLAWQTIQMTATGVLAYKMDLFKDGKFVEGIAMFAVIAIFNYLNDNPLPDFFGWGKPDESKKETAVIAVSVPLKMDKPDIGPKLMSVFLACAILVSGCANGLTYHDAITGATKTAPLIEPGIEASVKVVLDLAINDPVDREKKRILINGLASGVSILLDGKAHTPDEVAAILNQLVPNKDHWAKLISSITIALSTGYNQIDGDPKASIQLIEQVVTGLKNGSAL